MRNHLAHRYFDTAHAIVADTVTTDLPPLINAARRLLTRVAPSEPTGGDGDEPDWGGPVRTSIR